MSFVGFAAATVYVLIAAFSLYMTHQEHRWNPPPNRAYGLLGYGLCLAWPVMIFFAVLSVLLKRRAADHRDPLGRRAESGSIRG